MPICKNDPKKSYKGIEPSPKGLGFCAHAEKLGTDKKTMSFYRLSLKNTVFKAEPLKKD